MTNEIWKPIPNFQGYYASSLGRIKDDSGKIINQHKVSADGYLGISLKAYGVHYVHKLICLTFHDNPENKREANHINGIKTDNRAENLEWVTHQENMQHAWRTGLKKYKPLSEDARKKMSDSSKGELNPFYGKHHSEETLKKLSDAHKGKHHSEETRKKISESVRNNLSEEGRKKISEANKGRKMSEDTRKKMSEARRRYWQNQKTA